MLRIRTRKYKFFVLKHELREAVLTWKKGQGPFPEPVHRMAVGAVNKFFAGFNLVTVPAPSFHAYDRYPAWEAAARIAGECGLPIERLFPDPSGRTRMGWHGALQKRVPEIDAPAGRFILILDDILTTGHTLRVSCEAIIRRGSYPAALALC